MDFSETYRFSGPPPVYSPDGRYLATAVEYRLVVREVDTLQVLQLYSCLDAIDRIEWSPNSDHVLCALCKRSLVQVWSLNEPDWICKIDEGAAGVSHACWAPSGQDVLAVADFNIRTSIWNLVERSCAYLAGPKNGAAGLVFSPDGEKLALVERADCTDIVSILSTTSWEPLVRFQAGSTDLQEIVWNPDNTCIAIVDTSLAYKVLLYTVEGELLSTFSAYDNALGVKASKWSPSGQLLALGSYDQSARLINNVTWTTFLECDHPESLGGPEHVVVYQEQEELGGGGGPSVRSKYCIRELPAEVPTNKVPLDKPNPKLGVGHISFSHNGKFMATRNDNMPTALWIWNISTLELIAVLIHTQAIKSAEWDPLSERLAVCTGTTRLYLWSPEGASCVHIPLKSFTAQAIRWKEDGRTLLLMDRDAFCCAFIA